jgi:hypothetical protein
MGWAGRGLCRLPHRYHQYKKRDTIFQFESLKGLLLYDYAYVMGGCKTPIVALFSNDQLGWPHNRVVLFRCCRDMMPWYVAFSGAELYLRTNEC